MPSEKQRIEAQMALIERVCLKTGLDTDGLASVVGVKPDTMRKLRAGYQLAGEQTLKLIDQVEHLRSLKVQDRMPTINQRIEWILNNGTPREIEMLKRMIDFLYDPAASRAAGRAARKSVRYEVDAEE